MSTRINHNIASMIAQSSLTVVGKQLRSSIERLSTGLRINRASDDAAGLAMSEQLRTQIRGSRIARSNAEDGVSLLQIAEGAMNEVEAIIQRMRELTVQSLNDTLTDTERGFTNSEFQALNLEIDRISAVTQFNGQLLLDGSFLAKNFHVGANATANDSITVDISALDTGAAGLNTAIFNVSGTVASIQADGVLAGLDSALTRLNQQRSDVGTIINRLEHTITNLANAEYNQQAAESQIRDVDFALETARFTRNQILTQSATAMLSQANATPANVLSLLQ